MHVSTIQHQDTIRVTQPNLIAICFSQRSKLRLDSAASPLWCLDAETQREFQNFKNNNLHEMRDEPNSFNVDFKEQLVLK